MFSKILIANRGEIACRIIQTARRLGIKTVAVYSAADRDAHHVELADEAVQIGPAASRESYLVAEKIIAACRQTGAQAVHPGYGFLSENADFARRVEEEGITFIGPGPVAIAAMGDKIAARKLAAAAGVNCVPGVNEAVETPEQAVEIARSIGYTVMIKARAGGGGKGLRVALNDQEILAGFASCRNEARNSFGREGVFIEKFIAAPRHIEIQLLGDRYGNVIHLHERECSLQRRHQKVIEEAPSPFLSDATRQAMGEQAVALARAVQYESAGTVEFVVGQDHQFYFLEMNTRLQVEHPVTECITGLDLVELMIRVAAGERLPLTQADVRRAGWAMECRINAENPFRGFLPSTGRLTRFQPPATTMSAADPGRLYGVRLDTGVQEGGEIPVYYDSMIAKLIVHGENREEAIAKMREALNGFVIRGVATNIPFLSALLAHPRFVAGDLHTGFIAEHYGAGFRAEDVAHEDRDFLVALAAHMHRLYRHRAAGITGQLEGHELEVGEDFVVVALDQPGGDDTRRVRVGDFDAKTSSATVAVGAAQYAIRTESRLGALRVNGTCNGEAFTAQVERGVGTSPLALRVSHNGARLEALVLSPRAAELFALMPRKAPSNASRHLLSPMPGLLVEVAVQPGQKVLAGERIALIEAMKMESTLVASADGVVGRVLAATGETLAVNQPIVEFV